MRHHGAGLLAHHAGCRSATLLLPSSSPAEALTGPQVAPWPVFAGTRFRADMQRLQGELWDEDASLELEDMQDQHLKVGRGCSELAWGG